MARLTNEESQQVEQHEGALGCMASALALLDLMEVRIELAVSRQPSVLRPALNDLQHARRLIQRAQIYAGSPCPRRPKVINAAE